MDTRFPLQPPSFRSRTLSLASYLPSPSLFSNICLVSSRVCGALWTWGAVVSLTCIKAGIPTPCCQTGSPAACFSLSSQHPYPPAAQTGPSTTLTPLRPPLGPGESLPVPFKGVFFFSLSSLSSHCYGPGLAPIRITESLCCAAEMTTTL